MKLITAAALLLLSSPSFAETLRGPLAAELTVTPVESASAEGVGVEGIVLIRIDGDPRFLDAIDIEITSPAAVAEHAGALTLSVVGPISMEARADVASVVGEELLRQPLQRGGKTFYQVVLRDDADPDALTTVTRIGTVVPPQTFPLALTIVPRMKGLSEAIQAAEFTVTARPVTRNVAAIAVRYVHEDGSFFDPEAPLAPDFELTIDGQAVRVDSEYLVTPGLHRLRLRSQRYQDQEVTIGVDRGRSVTVDVPLRLALATVQYIVPRDASVYVNGRLREGSSGDFTVPPGEHTIVVVMGEYTVTRRFRVEERQRYSVSVTLDIVIEEIK